MSEKERCDEDTIESRTNDAAWYAQTPELMQLAANIPFSQATGTAFNLDLYNDETGSQAVLSNDFVIPGIMTMQLIPCPTGVTSPSSPLNIAATSIYSFVRHANSGTANYKAPDLMLYCVAMGQVYSYLNFLQRVYGCLDLYANMNRYLPRALVQAQGVDYNSLLLNKPNFKYGIDTLIHKAASLAVPAAFTYFHRLAFLFSGIYAEGESIKDQLYMYVPRGFMQFSDTASETGGSLQYIGFQSGTPKTYQQLIDYGNQLLDPIISSGTSNIMSGDILKAFGSNGILKLQTMPEVYIIQPTTDLTVLEQFQNATFINAVPSTLSITQSMKGLQSSLVSNVTFAKDPLTVGILNGAKVLTTILTTPTAADVMERTRLMLHGNESTDGMTVSMATEIPTYLDMWRIDPGTGLASNIGVPLYHLTTSSANSSTVAQALGIHCYLENFKFHPVVYYFQNYTNPDATELYNIAIDFDNYAIINTRDLSRMNEAALLSMFNVNSVAKAY